MTFVAQIRVSDVPGLEDHSGALVSFHFCDLCTKEGNMPFGWSVDQEPFAYEVRVFEDTEGIKPDGLGIAAQSVVRPAMVHLRPMEELPRSSDLPIFLSNHLAALVREPAHLESSKLGGWPSWVQDALWPTTKDGKRMLFLGQIDAILGEGSPWTMGGNAFLFIEPKQSGSRKAEYVIQTT